MALLGGLVGAGLGALASVVLSGVVQPGKGLDAAFQGGFAAAATSPLVAAGLAIGTVLTGLRIRNSLVLRAFALVGRSLVLLAGMALGAAFGCAAYLVWATAAASPGSSLGQAFERLALSFVRPGGPPTLFFLAGMAAGFAGTLMMAGRRVVGAVMRILGGGLVGAVAGLFIYSVAYVVIRYPYLPQDAGYVLHFAEAVYSGTLSEVVLVGVAALAGAFLSRYAWRLYGVLTFVALLFVILGYTAYTATVTIPTVPAGYHRVLSWLLFVFETASLLMVLLYSFYTIDVAARKHWRRTNEAVLFSPYYLPKVAIHVPTFNEPPELVQDTLKSLLALDYPADRFVIMVADDSTDAASAGPLKEFCGQNGVFYHHRTDRTGYKAGALNELLRFTPEDCNLIAVIDADYQVVPEYLKETVGHFVDPDLGWVQTPQDYRNRHQSFLTEQYYLADAYFYRTILPSRNEENSIIFCGTMGMLRRRALEEVGRWNEACITEDAELSVRLLNKGWRSLYINKTYGRGLIPATFEAYKKQHYRWAFGGGKIFRLHAGRFLFGRFTFRQRVDYLVGSMSWFEGALIFAIAGFVFAFGIADLTGLSLATHHAGEILLIGLVPMFLLLDSLTRVHLVLRRSVNLSFGGTLRILGMWSSVKFSNMRAALKALLGYRIPFVRTPKAPSRRMTRMESMTRAVHLTRFESLCAMALAVTAAGVLGHAAIGYADSGLIVVGRALLGFWLAYYALVFAAAPIYAYKSFSTLRPEGESVVGEAAPKEVTA